MKIRGRKPNGPRRVGARSPRSQAGGFTLLELLLVVVVLLAFFGAWVLSFAPSQRGVELDEGLDRLQSLTRYARSHAAQTGRRVRLVFEEAPAPSNAGLDGSLARLKLEWEPDPLGAPEQFRPLHLPNANILDLNAMIGFKLTEEPDDGILPRTTASGGETGGEEEDETRLGLNEEAFARAVTAVLFYPDGTVDPIEVLAVSRMAEDSRQCRVRFPRVGTKLVLQWQSRAETGDEWERGIEASEPAEEYFNPGGVR